MHESFLFSASRRVGSVATALAVIALVSLAAPGAATAQITPQALDCNSDLTIGLPPGPFAPGQTVAVTLTLVNGPSTDAGDNPVAQQFDKIDFFPSCTTTIPCVVNPALPVAFANAVSTTCAVTSPWTINLLPGGIFVEFSFLPNPPALTLPAAASALDTTTCDLVFDVTINPAAPNGSVPIEASTAGVCDVTGLDSSAVASANITVTAPPAQTPTLTATPTATSTPTPTATPTVMPGDDDDDDDVAPVDTIPTLDWRGLALLIGLLLLFGVLAQKRRT